MNIFQATAEFPKDEMCSLTSRIRRSSRSVAINFIQAWRKRRYAAAFIAKLSDAQTEAAETQAHLAFALLCGSLTRQAGRKLYQSYDRIIRTLVGMIDNADRWLVYPKPSITQVSES